MDSVSNNFQHTRALKLLAVLAIIALAGCTAPGAGDEISTDEASSKVLEWYELATNTEAEVLTVNEEGNLYRVVLRPVNTDGGGQTTDIYITRDGKRIVQNPTSLENVTAQARGVRQFYQCLEDSNVRYHGQLATFQNETQQSATFQMRRLTAAQFQSLPLGNAYASSIFQQCSAEEIQQGQCLYFAMGNQTLPAPQSQQGQLAFASMQDLSTFSGCSIPESLQAGAQ